MKQLVIPLTIILSLLLAACPAGGPGEAISSGGPADGNTTDAQVVETGDGPEAAADLASELSVYNWSDYIAEEVLTQYEEEYGVDIVYDTYASNEDLLAKLQAGATGYDVIFPSDYMVAQMIELGLLAEIDTGDLSNFSNLDAAFLDAPFDPGNQHCVPYQWGTTGIAYSPSHSGYFAEDRPDSWAYLFEPEMLELYSDAGVNVLNDQRELLAAALFYLGYSPNTTERAELEEARDLVLEAKPYWKTFNSEDYDDSLLVPGEVAISHAWSGDAAAAYWNTYDEERGDGEWAYAIPQEGAVKWLDNICITASTQRYDTALHFVNYMLDAEVGAAITNYTYYASPNEAAEAHILDEILTDPGIYPPDEVQAELEWLHEVGDAIFIYDEMWTAIKG